MPTLTPEKYFWKEKLEQIYYKRCHELQRQMDILEAHARRMEDAICEWCRMSGWAVEPWKQQPHNAELFRIAKEVMGGKPK